MELAATPRAETWSGSGPTATTRWSIITTSSNGSFLCGNRASTTRTPVLSDEDIRIFPRGRFATREPGDSFERFLSFLGLARDEKRIGPGPKFQRGSGVFTSPNHNWLRITRVLTSLRLLGLEADGQAFFACLQDLVKNGQAKVSNDTITYWQNATFPDRPVQR